MNVHKVNGRHVMLNDVEADRWVACGRYERIPAGDAADAEYTALRDEMIKNGDEAFYVQSCPPSVSTPPALLGRK